MKIDWPKEFYIFLYFCQNKSKLFTYPGNYIYISTSLFCLSTLKNLYILGRFQNARKGNVKRYILSTKLSIPPSTKKKVKKKNLKPNGNK